MTDGEPDTAPAIPLKQNGVYLITGGAGGLGLMLAEQLAVRYQARLMLVNRSALNEQQQQTIAALQQKGAELMFVRADISHKNKASVARVAGWAEARLCILGLLPNFTAPKPVIPPALRYAGPIQE